MLSVQMNTVLNAHLDPNAPEDFEVTAFTTTTVSMSWNPPNGTNNATFEKYRITYFRADDSQTVMMNETSSTSFTLTGLSPGVQYTISLFAVSDEPNVTVSERAGDSAITVRTKPNAPQSFSRETVSTTTIGLSWTAPDSAYNATFAKYRITYSRADDSQTVMMNETTSTSFTLTELSPGVQYTISLLVVSDEPNVTISTEASGGPLTVRTSEFFKLYYAADQ
ncbi:receptor-type tyrosine-protein phosphatase H-like [Branchiostoma floridae x Branchiostoma japonicum]